MEPDTVSKPNYKYIIIYRTPENRMQIWNGSAGNVREYVTKYESFETLDKLKSWINGASWTDERKDIYVQPNTILGIYDLSSAKQLKFDLKEVPRIRKREVVIEEDKWIDKFYEIKP